MKVQKVTVSFADEEILRKGGSKDAGLRLYFDAVFLDFQVEGL